MKKEKIKKNKNIVELLKNNKQFTIMWGGQLVSNMGDAINWMSALSFVSLIAPTIGTSILMFWLMLPIVLFGTVAGVVVDRFSRKRIMMLVNSISGIIVFSLVFMMLSIIQIRINVTKYNYENFVIKKSEFHVNELSNTKKNMRLKNNVEIKIKSINNEKMELILMQNFEEEDEIEIVITSSSDDYEKLILKKKGEYYEGEINLSEKKGKINKKNHILEIEKKGTMKISFIEKKGPTYMIYVMMFLISTLTQFFTPAKSAILPDLVRKEDLVIANSISASASRIIMVIGGAVAGFMIGRYGIIIAFSIDAFTYIVSVLTIFFVKETKFKKYIEEKAKMKKNSEESFFKEFKEGLKYIVTKKIVRFAVFKYITIMAVGGIGYIFLVKYSNETLQMGVEGLGYLQTSLGIGIVTGSIILSYLSKKIKKIKIMKFGFILIGIATIGFAMSENIYSAVLIGFFGGIGASFIMVLTETLIQIVVTANLRGRIFAVMQTMTNASFAIFTVLTGLLIAEVNETQVFLIIGFSLIIIGVAGEIQEFFRKGERNGGNIK